MFDKNIYSDHDDDNNNDNRLSIYYAMSEYPGVRN